MFRSKDLYNRNIYDSYGKELGRVKDMVVDFINAKVSGFLVFNSKDNENMRRVDIEDLVGENSREYEKHKVEDLFSQVKNMEVIDKSGVEKGLVNDLILDEESFEIKAFVLQKDEVEKVREGNEIILTKDVVFEDGYIQYIGKSNVVFKNITYKKA